MMVFIPATLRRSEEESEGLALLAGDSSPDDAVTFFIVGAVCGVLTYREFPSYLKNLIERMKKDGRS